MQIILFQVSLHSLQAFPEATPPVPAAVGTCTVLHLTPDQCYAGTQIFPQVLQMTLLLLPPCMAFSFLLTM